MYKINLLPQHLQREGAIDIRRLAAILAVALPPIVIVVCYLIFLVNYGIVKSELSEIKTQYVSLAPVAEQVAGITNERGELEAAAEEFDRILKRRRSWSGLMYDLGNVAPVDLWLTSLEIADRPFHTLPDNNQESDPYALPSLVSFKGLAKTLPSVGVYIKNLNGLPYFAEVKLVKAKAISEGLEFEIVARIKDEG